MRKSAAALLLAACAHTPPPAPPAEPPAAAPLDLGRVEAIREEARALIARQTELAWKRWVSGEEVDLAASYAGHGALFEPEARALVAQAAAESGGDRRRALQALRLYQATERVAQGAAAFTDKAEAMAAAATVEVGGQSVPYAELADRAAHEPDYDARGLLAAAELSAIEKIAPILREREARIESLVKEVGFESYVALASALRRADPAAMARLAEAALAGTEAIYAPSLAAMAARELGPDPKPVRRADLGRLLLGPGADGAFPSGGALPAARRTLAGLGIDLGALKNVQVNEEVLPHKNPRAVALAVRVPEDIRVSVKPQGGVEDYRALLHELGHALHFAYSRVPEWELALLGSGAAAEAHALLLEGLTEEPAWLSAMTTLGGSAQERLLRDRALHRLYLVRRAAARLLFEVEWKAGALADPGARYRELLARACGCAVAPEEGARFLIEHEDFLLAADELRGWLLAAQLRSVLARRFGDAWWTESGAGAFLAELWAEGQKLSADELAQRLGAQRVDHGPFIAEMKARLVPEGGR